MKKWRPPNRSNLFGVAAAMSPIAKDDVFEAKIVLAGATASYNEFIIFFHEFINYESTIFFHEIFFAFFLRAAKCMSNLVYVFKLTVKLAFS